MKRENENTHICFVTPYGYSHLNPGSANSAGGAERQQYLIGKELVRRGYKVSFIVINQNGPEFEKIDGINVWKSLPMIRYNYKKDMVKFPYFLYKLIKRIYLIDADVYYSRANPPLSALVGSACKILRKKYIYSIGNDSDVNSEMVRNYSKTIRVMYLRSMKSADMIIAQTSRQKKLLRQNFGLQSKVVPNGYSLPDRSELLDFADRDHILWVGTIEKEQKKPERFLRLAEKIEEGNFVMVGSGKNPEYVQEVQSRAQEIPNLTYKGFVPPDEIHECYRTSVLVVNTSDYEGFPNVFLEAWRYSVPVLSLHHTLDGILVNEIGGIHAGSFEALVESVRDLWKNRAKAAKLGEGGRDHMVENYDMDNIIDEYCCIL
ncbi:glycosyltransferase family 4 protein [Halovivax gelatinilyticus]|uniref:glycosyltransferase family 4 protein n=1 Tax=Halovivax gelatinilyticus TaxID=2961597 RepID=UPI0020CA7D51|nr:glycosyltransferase family 4 protein [Halovivax gelatinilyticus]